VRLKILSTNVTHCSSVRMNSHSISTRCRHWPKCTVHEHGTCK